MDHEGTAVAEWLTAAGFTVGVLKYRLPNGHYQVPLQDAQQALRLMRSRAPAWKVDPGKVGILGFSAGGHLASTVGTHFTEDFSSGKGDHLNLSHRPDFMVLVYPVITMMDDYTHHGSQRGLLGEHPTEAQLQRFSNHLRVTDQTPPTFLVHSSDDEAVHPFNSTTFYTSLVANGIASELHLFEQGGHGYALSEASPARAWATLAEGWLYRTVGKAH
jgi:acetyl esterase/lipase